MSKVESLKTFLVFLGIKSIGVTVTVPIVYVRFEHLLLKKMQRGSETEWFIYFLGSLVLKAGPRAKQWLLVPVKLPKSKVLSHWT